jgi:homoisocitrate dehydrogenase
VRVALLAGDGIGPEVTAAAAQVLRAVAERFEIDLELVEGEVGLGAYQRHGDSLPEATLGLVNSADATLLGAVTTPPGIPGYRSPVLRLRQDLGLYACVRPVRSLPGARPPVDLVVVRENTEGLYCGRERAGEDFAVTERWITRSASERIARAAFRIAAGRKDARVTVVHKANVLRATCGLFRRSALAVAEEYPEVAVDEMLVDTAAMELARRPERFSVIVTTNLFGDILSDVACIHGGGLGIARSANLGDKRAVFEPVHGSAPDIAGQGRANPLAAILSAASLLAWCGKAAAARVVEAAVNGAISARQVTPDLGGDLDTAAATAAVVAGIAGG